MEIAEALKQSIRPPDFTVTKIAALCGVTEGSVRDWMRGAIPAGDKLLILQRDLPGFKELLNRAVA